ncbi:MAG: hypothetical protein PHU12_03505 [Candidatus Aenigmarchaeota archaeon]|nr:hypothetical protein [Candidatus Aenigmarchaeota archaeon]
MIETSEENSFDREQTILNKIGLILKNKGFENISYNRGPDSSWAFDIFAESNSVAMGIELRRNNYVPDILIEKINKIKKYNKKLYIYFIFENQPNPSTINFLKRHKLGIGIFRENKIYAILNSGDFSNINKKIPPHNQKHKNPNVPSIYIFISSKIQNKDGLPFKERKIAKSVIRNIAQTHNIPIIPITIEDDLKGSTKFSRIAIKKLEPCQFFVCILGKEHGKIVEKEVKKAFKFIRNKKFILILRKEMKWEDFEEAQKKLLDFLEDKNDILPYSGQNDIRKKLECNLMKMVSEYCSIKKIKTPFKF